MRNVAIESFQVTKLFKDNTKPINSLSFHKSGEYLVTGSDDESLHVYHTGHGQREKEILSKKYGVDLVRFTHNPKQIVCASKNDWDHSLRLLDITSNKYLKYFKGHRDQVNTLSLNPKDESFISSSLDCTLRIWDLQSQMCQGMLRRIEAKSVVGFDPEGKVFAVASMNRLRLFDVRNYEPGPFSAWSIEASKNLSTWISLDFSPDGKFFVLTARNLDHIKVVDSFDGNEIAVLTGFQDCNCAAKISFDSRFIAVGTADRKIAVWEMKREQLALKALKPLFVDLSNRHSASIRNLVWSPNAPWFVSACQNLAFCLPQEDE